MSCEVLGFRKFLGFPPFSLAKVFSLLRWIILSNWILLLNIYGLPIVDFIYSRLKLGIGNFGNYICAGYPVFCNVQEILGFG